MIRVLADQYLNNIAHFLPENIDLSFFDSNQPLESIPDGIQATLIRTVTKINRKTLPSLPASLKFLGTGSAGMDHVDEQYLRKNDVSFANAAGCNARSVAEYVTVVLLLWAHEHKYDLANFRVGIIGAGHTGTAVQDLLNRLDVQTVAYDPPRAERESDFRSASLQDVLECDILTFHTPLTHKTDYPTFHWLDVEKLNEREFKLIINASRGSVVDEQAVLKAHQTGQIENFVFDVWENEPIFDDEIARRAYIKTPHIAGYSLQAKLRASRMLVEALTKYFNFDYQIPELKNVPQKRKPPQMFWSLTDVLTFYHPILDYETRFRMLIGRDSESKRSGFNNIRNSDRLRNEFAWLYAPGQFMKRFQVLQKLGFKMG